MSTRRLKNYAPTAILLATVTVGFPAASWAQGRGNGRGPQSNLDKKCAKFVNCHDARDGRLDGRGPRVNQIPQPADAGIFGNRRNRNRDRDDGVFDPRTRNRRIDRDGDGDIDRDDRDWNRRTRHRRVDRDGDGDIDRHDERLRRVSRTERWETRDRRARRPDRNNID